MTPVFYLISALHSSYYHPHWFRESGVSYWHRLPEIWIGTSILSEKPEALFDGWMDFFD